MLSYLLSDGILQQMHDKKIKDSFLKQNKGCSAIIVKDIYLFCLKFITGINFLFGISSMCKRLRITHKLDKARSIGVGRGGPWGDTV